MDTDEWIEQKEGKPIHQIFSEKGEVYFRALESEYLRKTVELHKIVVATGGGTPLFHDNLAWMNNNGLTIYLKAAPELLASRLEGQTALRPLLKGKTGHDLLKLIMRYLKKREPVYEKAQMCYELKDGNQKYAEDIAFHLSKFVRT